MINNSDVKVLKFITGEEVIARIKEGPENLLTLDNPFVVQLSEEGVALFPWILAATYNEDVNVTPISVISISNPKEKLIAGYNAVINQEDDLEEEVTMEYEDDEYEFVNDTIH